MVKIILSIAFKHIFSIVCLTSMAGLLTACGKENVSDSGQVNTESEVLTSTNELRDLIELPFDPTSVRYQTVRILPMNNESRVPGPSESILYAVIKASQTDLNATLQSASERWQTDWHDNHFVDWFPQSVRDSFIVTSDSRYELSTQSYDAFPVFGKSPYVNGTFFVTSEGGIFLRIGSY